MSSRAVNGDKSCFAIKMA